MNEEGTNLEDHRAGVDDVGDTDNSHESFEGAAQDSLLNSGSPVTNNAAITDIEEWHNAVSEDHSWLESNGETSSHFSDSSSEEVVHDNEASVDGLESDAVEYSTEIDTSADPDMTVLQKAELEVAASKEWMNEAISGGTLFPVIGSQADDKDEVGVVYRRDAELYRDGKTNLKYSNKGKAPPKAKGRKSPLREVKAAGELSPSRDSASYFYIVQRDEARKELKAVEKEREEWVASAHDQYHARKQVEKDLSGAYQEVQNLRDEIDKLKSQIITLQEEVEKKEEALEMQDAGFEMRHGTLEMKYRKALENLTSEKEQWKKAFDKQRPYADAERERLKRIAIGLEDYESVQTQTDPVNFESRGTQSDDQQIEDLFAENRRLIEERSRLQKLLDAVKTWTEGKVWTDKPVPGVENDDNAPALPDLPPVYTSAHASLLTPAPLPSANAPLSSYAPPTPSSNVLKKPAHWIERERNIRNTDQWKRNRDAILRRLEGDSIDWRTPNVGPLEVVG